MKTSRLFPCLLVMLGVSACKGAQPPAATAPPAAATVPAPPPATAPAAADAAGTAAAAPAAPDAPAAEPPAKPVPAVLPEVLAKVNGEEVHRWELETALKQAEAKAGVAVPADKRDEVLRSILDELVTYHMLAQEAGGRKLEVSPADIEAQMASIRKGFPTEEAYKAALAARSVTADQLRQQTRRTLQAQKLIEAEVTSKVTVQDADVDSFYAKNVARFKQGETVHASHIFISVPQDAPPAQKEQARVKAQEALKQLKAGADFAAVAKEASNDATGANGGDLGFFGKGDLPPDFEAVAFGLKPGGMSDVVELGAGFHIIKVHERRAPRTAPLAEVRDQVKDFLLQNERQAKLEQFLGQTKAKTRIEILV